MAERSEPASRGLLVALALFALAFFLTLARYRPPAPRPADAPADEFSAGRAREILQRLVGDGRPHPVGSAANAAVRGRVLAELAGLGYAPQVQNAFACTSYGACAEVKNVLARLPGREPDPAVLLAAHYDSVGAGPGASDDGAGTAAVLEIARVLKAGPPPRRPIIFLIDDGEEAGLLGARAFVSEHPWAKEVRAAVNLEARGTSGVSRMFETGSASAWLMGLYAAALKRPMTSSLYYAVYKHLPNDTDFTVFKAAGIQGFNFAFIGDVVHYHTPLDNFANAGQGSLQQQGDNALAAVRALAQADLADPPKGEAVFFDVFALRIVRWPSGPMPAAALAIMLLLWLVIERVMRRSVLRLSSLVWGLAGWPAIILSSAILALGLARALEARGVFPSNWVAYPVPALAAFWALGFLVAAVLAILFHRRAGYWGLWCGGWAWWVLLALVTARVVPGVSYVFLVPAATAGVCGLPATVGLTESRQRRDAAVVLPAVVAACLLFVLVSSLYDAGGIVVLPLITALVALLAATLAPLIAAAQRGWRWVLPVAAGVVMVAGAARQFALPAYSPGAPERLNIALHQDADSGQAQWLAFPDSGKLPPELKRAALFGSQPQTPFPWSSQRAFAAPAAPAGALPPALSVIEYSKGAGGMFVHALLGSPRGAPVAALLFPPAAKVRSFMMQGREVPEPGERALRWMNGWKRYACLTMPAEGVEISFVVAGSAPAEVVVMDQSPGLPAAGSDLLVARPATATPSQDGDVTVVSRRARLWP